MLFRYPSGKRYRIFYPIITGHLNSSKRNSGRNQNPLVKLQKNLKYINVSRPQNIC